MTYKLFKIAIGAAFLALTLIGAAFAQDAGADPVTLTKEACAALLADNGALITKWLAILGTSTFVASVLANFKRLQSVPVLGLFLNIVAANWATWLRIAAQRASKSGVAIVPLLAVSLVLAACGLTPQQIQMAQTDISAGIKAACLDLEAASKVNPNSPVAPWANATCPKGIAAASLVTNSATLQFVGQLIGQVQATAPAVAAPAKAS